MLAAAEDVGIIVEPLELREAVRAAERAATRGAIEQLELIAAPLGLRVAPVIASATVLCTSSQVGAALVWDGDAGWIALHRTDGASARGRDHHGRERSLTAEQLAKEAGAPSPDHPLVVALFEPALSLAALSREGGPGRPRNATHRGGPPDATAHDHHDPDVGRRSLGRIIDLLRLERADVATCFVYAVFIGLATLIAPIAVQSLVNTVVFTTLAQPILVLAIAVLLALSFSSALRALQEWVVERLQQRLFVRSALDFATRLPRAQLAAMEQRSAADRALHFFDVIAAQKASSQLLTDGLALALQALAGLILLAFYHPLLLAFDVVLVATLAVVVFGFGRNAIATSVHESHAKYDVASWIVDVGRNVEAVRMHPHVAVERAEELARRYVTARRQNFRIVFRQLVASLAVQTVASACLLGVGGYLVLVGQLTVGQLVAAEIIVASVVGGFAKLAKHLLAVYDLATSLEKMGAVLDLPMEPRGGIDHLEGEGPARLCVENLHFDHRDGRSLFDGFDLKLEPGRRLAVLGPHGAGKSTFADLVVRLREPRKGTIQVDGVDVRELDPEELRRHVAVVRSAEILDSTVLDNVALGRRHVGPREAHGALDAVGLGPTVARLRKGLATPLVAGGKPLTSGEVQRLILARALVGGPRLLVVDGLLDGLDPATLHDLEDCLLRLEARTTVLVMTSDPAVAQFCHDVVHLAPVRRGLAPRPEASILSAPEAVPS